MTSVNNDFRKKVKLSNPIHLLAVGLGSGMSPVMPGTFGSIAAIPVWFLFCFISSPIIYWLILVLAFISGIYFCQKTSDDTGTHDSGHIVWDEFVGMWITLFFIPTINWYWILIAFLSFRVFDIVKPWPIRWFDKKVPGGFGIMIDDVIAAIFASIAVILLTFII